MVEGGAEHGQELTIQQLVSDLDEFAEVAHKSNENIIAVNDGYDAPYGGVVSQDMRDMAEDLMDKLPKYAGLDDKSMLSLKESLQAMSEQDIRGQFGYDPGVVSSGIDLVRQIANGLSREE